MEGLILNLFEIIQIQYGHGAQTYAIANFIHKRKKTFKEYAQQYRELEAQVQPPLLERELVVMFINTL